MNSFIQLAADQDGKKVQAYENTVGGVAVETIPVVVVDPAGYADSYVQIEDITSRKKVAYSQSTVNDNAVHAITVVAANYPGT